MPFPEKGRIPVRPFDYNVSNNGELAYEREMMVDYNNGHVYVKNEEGRIIDVYSSDSTKGVINNCIKENPTLITDATLFTSSDAGYDTDVSVKQAVSDIDTRVDNLEKINHDNYFDKQTDNTVSGGTLFNGAIRIGNDSIVTSLPSTVEEGRVLFLIVDD